MAKQYETVNTELRNFILCQNIFFTASGTASSRVNVSPREIGALRVVNNKTVIYLDRTGSGNETAAHIMAKGRLTIMFCALSGSPQIMRLYGAGEALGWESDKFKEFVTEYYGNVSPLGTRQIIKLRIDLVQTSCGYGVPLFDYQGERKAIENWHGSKGPEGIQLHWKEKNLSSIDGLTTGLKLYDD